MNIIFDLDGTLIDSSERMYRLFNVLVPRSGLSKEDYWNQKRNKVNHKMLLDRYFPETDFDEFHSLWMAQIEEEEYLLMDQLYPDTLEVLTQLSSRYGLYLLTARQYRARLLRELERLGISRFFLDILTTENKFSKEQLLRNYCEAHPGFVKKTDYFVSDMGKDITLGNSLGYNTVAITHGFMNKKRLQEYYPTYVIDELIELLSSVPSLR